MNFLYPLFLAGVAIISLPIILHMIRRHTRKRVTFSSLMFLRTTIPRFKSRSRLEDILLLILRCVILILLALAFSRPFFQQPAEETTTSFGRRLVLLIDTSASMRRAGVWDRAVAEAQSALEDIEPTDRVSIISFDQDTHTLIGFESWSELEPEQRVPAVTKAISSLSPGWTLTNLGNALVTAAEAMEDDEINVQQPVGQRRIVLISDLQQGSNLDALHTYEWPEDTELIIKSVRSRDTTNAAMQVIANRDYLTLLGGDDSPRIRIINSADALTEKFQLNWADDDPAGLSSEPVDVYVPPGRSIVTSVPAEPNGVTGRKLILTGDNHEFDNTLYLAPTLEQQLNILYIANDTAGNSAQMLYYVQRAFQRTRVLNPQILIRSADEEILDSDITRAHLIIIADAISPEHLSPLRRMLESGGTTLLVIKSLEAAATLAGLAGLDYLDAQEAQVDEYAMLGTIEFGHPLLASFSEPRFRDFTKIHFWKYRKINADDLPQARVLASFDNGDPALIEVPVGDGTLLVLTSGWQPSDSQLALSSKFVPLLYSVLEYNDLFDGQQSQYVVGDSIRIPRTMSQERIQIRIRKPDSSLVSLQANEQVFTQADLPGIYTIGLTQQSIEGDTPMPSASESTSDAVIETEQGNRIFAVNLPVQESQTAPLPLEELEQFGILFESPSITTGAEQTRQTRTFSSFVEMEHEQKIWRWLFITVLAVLMIETWLAGWLTRPAKSTQETKSD